MSSMRSASSITSRVDAGEQQTSALEMIEQAARRRDQDIDAAHELGVLIVEGNAADDERDIELLAAPYFSKLSCDLGREFARRLEDQRARHAALAPGPFEHGEHRQRERGGLAGAGLRDAEHVAPREHVRDRLIWMGVGVV